MSCFSWDFSRLSRVMLAGILTAAVISGCSSGSPSASSSASSGDASCLTNKPVPLAVAIGARSNVPKYALPNLITPLMEATANDQQQISLIRIDGQPKVFSPPPFQTDAQNNAARDQDLVNYLNNEVGPIMKNQITAQAPEADVLAALDLAAAATGSDGNIVIVDSGLQTVAPLDYRQGLLMAPPGDVVTFLKQQNLLPDLKGRHVLLSGFGYTAAPQPTLSEAQQKNVVNQWVAIVQAAGACVTVNPLPNTAAEMAGLPSVGVVTPPAAPTFSNCGTIQLTDAGTVGFIVGKSAFRDQSAADATLSQLAKTLKQGTEHITVIGSTSSEGGDALNNPLSLNRAVAVEKALTAQGVPAGRITVIGDGSHWPGRVKDIGPRGVLLPGPAEQDREVIIQLPRCSG